MKEKYKGVRFESDMLETIEEKASEEHRSFSNMVRVLILEALEARSQGKPIALGE